MGAGLYTAPNKTLERSIKMKLEVHERIILQNILPHEGDYITLKLVRKLKETLSFSEKEIAELEFKNHWRCPKCDKVEVAAETLKCTDCDIYMKPAGSVSWNEDKSSKVNKEVHIGGKMLALCETTLKKLSDDGKLTEQHISLYEKFNKAEDE